MVAKARRSPFLYFIIPIVGFVIFGDLVFDIGFLSRSKEIKQIKEINSNKVSKPIFFDPERYIKLTQYHSNMNKKYPSSWIDLNNQLFCPIKYSLTLNPINTISNGAERLLKAIYKLQ